MVIDLALIPEGIRTKLLRPRATSFVQKVDLYSRNSFSLGKQQRKVEDPLQNRINVAYLDDNAGARHHLSACSVFYLLVAHNVTRKARDHTRMGPFAHMTLPDWYTNLLPVSFGDLSLNSQFIYFSSSKFLPTLSQKMII